jgi:hypothetical protein
MWVSGWSWGRGSQAWLNHVIHIRRENFPLRKRWVPLARGNEQVLAEEWDQGVGSPNGVKGGVWLRTVSKQREGGGHQWEG